MKVKDQGQKIVIEPADPEVIYVPEYDPWVVYGFPVAPWPGWYWYPGLYWTSPGFGFGLGFDIGFFGGFGWGWHHWGYDWHHNNIEYNHNTYISHSTTFVNRNYYATVPGDIHPMVPQKDFTAEMHFTVATQRRTAGHAAVATTARLVDSTAAGKRGATPLVVFRAWEDSTDGRRFSRRRWRFPWWWRTQMTRFPK